VNIVNASDEADLTAADKRFAANLRAARERKGLSQKQLAEEMFELGFRFRQQTIARIEAADRVVGVGESRALARACGTTVDALVRPDTLARDGWMILDAARTVREARDQSGRLQVRLSNALTELEQLIKSAENGGEAHAIAEEIAIGRRALGYGEGPVDRPS
jgi:ribosome-binding protein aMBF1 (putative translation factor)